MLLKAENINKRFRSGEGYIEVLKSASLQVDKGEFVILSGQSGSGKSTLLYILGGLIKPDSGQVEYNGKPLRDYNSDDFDRLRNKKIGFVFQMHHLMPDFTALENTIIPAMIKGENKEKAIENACRLMSDLSIYDRRTHYPGQLSGGEQQRVAVARALINSPELLLADEPTGNLDQENADSLIKIMMKLTDTSNVGVLVATHNPELAKRARKAFHLAEGRIIDQETK